MDRLFFSPDHQEILHLSKKDKKLSKLIEEVGTIEIALDRDYYSFLIKRIIAQQLSLKSAYTITKRVEQLWLGLKPEHLQNISDNDLRSAGVSRPKLKYMHHLTEQVLNGNLQFNRFIHLDDNEVMKELLEVKGIGKWTAEMFLIFSLGRLNVLSFGDVSIQNSIRWLYKIPKDVPLELNFYYEKWKPYNSIASLYLWESVDMGILNKNWEKEGSD